MSDLTGIAVRIDDRKDGDVEPARLGDADILFADIDDEKGGGQPVHVAQAGEVLLQLVQGMRQPNCFFFRQPRQIASVPLLLQPFHVVDATLDGLEVGQRSAQPSLVHVPLVRALGFGGDDILGLLLGADEQHLASAGGQLHHRPVRVVDQPHRLLQIDDVDPVALRENVAAHARVPSPGLVAEVNAGLQQGLHGDRFQSGSRIHRTLRRAFRGLYHKLYASLLVWCGVGREYSTSEF